MAMQGNPVGRLQEHAQAGAGNHPQYEVTSSMGESHCPMFVMQVRYLGQTAEGEGTNKKMAKAVAARNMLALVSGGDGEVGEAGEEVDSTEMVEATISTNTVGELQEFCIFKGLGQAEYKDLAIEGPDHMRLFTVACITGERSAEAKGSTKKAAKKKAAKIVLEMLKADAGEWRNTSNNGTNDVEDEAANNGDDEKLIKHNEEPTESQTDNLEDKELSDKMNEIVVNTVEDQDEGNTPQYNLRQRN